MRIAMAAADARDQMALKLSGEDIAPRDLRKDPAFQSMLALGARFEAALANASLAMAKAARPDDASVPEPFEAHDSQADAQVDGSEWKEMLEKSIASDVGPVPPPPESSVLVHLPTTLKYEPLVLNRKVKSRAQQRKERAAKKAAAEKRKMESGVGEGSSAIPGMEGMMEDDDDDGEGGRKPPKNPLDIIKPPPPIRGVRSSLPCKS